MLPGRGAPLPPAAPRPRRQSARGPPVPRRPNPERPGRRGRGGSAGAASPAAAAAPLRGPAPPPSCTEPSAVLLPERDTNAIFEMQISGTLSGRAAGCQPRLHTSNA